MNALTESGRRRGVRGVRRGSRDSQVEGGRGETSGERHPPPLLLTRRGRRPSTPARLPRARSQEYIDTIDTNLNTFQVAPRTHRAARAIMAGGGSSDVTGRSSQTHND